MSMNRIETILAAAALSLSAGFLPAFAKDAINTFGSDHNVAIGGLDTVAFFTEKKPVQGKDSISYEWKGAVWLFVSDADRTLFAADPEKYAPQWGGYCAVGISDGHVSKNPVKGSYDIHDGKLYLFAAGRKDDFDQWRKVWLERSGGPAGRVSKGDSNWQVLKARVEAGEVAPKLAGQAGAAN
jgi:YHS domain-containing protein